MDYPQYCRLFVFFKLIYSFCFVLFFLFLKGLNLKVYPGEECCQPEVSQSVQLLLTCSSKSICFN